MKNLVLKSFCFVFLLFFSFNSFATISPAFTIDLPEDMKFAGAMLVPIVRYKNGQQLDYYSEFTSQSKSSYGDITKEFCIKVYTPTETWPTHLWDQIKTQWEEVMKVPLESQLVNRTIDHLNLSKRANITDPQIFSMNNQTYSISYIAVDATQITVLATQANNFYYVITLTSTSPLPYVRTEQMNTLIDAVKGMTFMAPYWK